jgi:hypothetical protein
VTHRREQHLGPHFFEGKNCQTCTCTPPHSRSPCRTLAPVVPLHGTVLLAAPTLNLPLPRPPFHLPGAAGDSVPQGDCPDPCQDHDGVLRRIHRLLAGRLGCNLIGFAVEPIIATAHTQQIKMEPGPHTQYHVAGLSQALGLWGRSALCDAVVASLCLRNRRMNELRATLPASR